MERTADEIWIVTREPTLVEATRAMIDDEPAPTIRHFSRLAELAEFKGQLPAIVALIDIDPEPRLILDMIEPLISRHSATRFVALARQSDNELLMAAMNAGARHFVRKSEMAQELPPILRRLRTQTAQDQKHGSVITVLSAGGGCGATTLAVNLARDLPADVDHPALLIDMDWAYGALADYLGLQGEYGLAEVLAHEPHIDPQLVATTALKYDDRLHVLINPVSVNFARPAPLRWDRIEPAIRACRQAYRWVVVDAPRMPFDALMQLANLSQVTLIVGQLTVKDVRASRRMHQTLLSHGVNESSIRHVINRYRSRHSMISLSEAQRALGDSQLWLIKNDFGAAVESINLGQPLAECAPRSVTRRDIRHLAEGLATLNGSTISPNGADHNGRGLMSMLR